MRGCAAHGRIAPTVRSARRAAGRRARGDRLPSNLEPSSPTTSNSTEGPLDEEAARVLMGRDLSRGGMRVNPNPLLAVGMKLRLAVHAETRETPLILNAVVDRDDGERGLVLRFGDLSAELSRYLDYVIHALPLVIDDDDDEGCLDHGAARGELTAIATFDPGARPGREMARGAARERDDVGARVARSGRPARARPCRRRDR